uniref:Uncharacterized protein n=1 Tax=Arundo donax TaxID=35708 RepID=A0A0A8YP50_ARUDO
MASRMTSGVRSIAPDLERGEEGFRIWVWGAGDCADFGSIG